MSPAVVIRPILLLLDSANHSAPSGPAAIPAGQANAVGTGYSVMYPAVVIRPILSPSCSVNHSAPSGPATIPIGQLPAVGMGYSVTYPAVVIRPIWLLLNSVNHSAPSGPTVSPLGSLLEVGRAYSVTSQAVEIRPILPMVSVNHSRPAPLRSHKGHNAGRAVAARRCCYTCGVPARSRRRSPATTLPTLSTFSSKSTHALFCPPWVASRRQQPSRRVDSSAGLKRH